MRICRPTLSGTSCSKCRKARLSTALLLCATVVSFTGQRPKRLNGSSQASLSSAWGVRDRSITGFVPGLTTPIASGSQAVFAPQASRNPRAVPRTHGKPASHNRRSDRPDLPQRQGSGGCSQGLHIDCTRARSARKACARARPWHYAPPGALALRGHSWHKAPANLRPRP